MAHLGPSYPCQAGAPREVSLPLAPASFQMLANANQQIYKNLMEMTTQSLPQNFRIYFSPPFNVTAPLQ